MYLGKAWYDWVMIDWGKDYILPGQIWCFVDLRNIPKGLAHECGIYAVIESADANTDEEEIDHCSLFVPYIKEIDVSAVENGIAKRKFYLVPVDAFYSPAVLIPDLGNENKNAYLSLVPRTEWSDQFVGWLGTEHTKEFTEDN